MSESKKLADDGFLHSGVFCAEEEVSRFKAMLRYGQPVFYVSDNDMLRAHRRREQALQEIDDLAIGKYGLRDLGHVRDLSDGEVCKDRWGLSPDGEFIAQRSVMEGWEPVESPNSSGDRILGQHWLEVALERVRAGESEADVLEDYGLNRSAHAASDALELERQRDEAVELLDEAVELLADIVSGREHEADTCAARYNGNLRTPRECDCFFPEARAFLATLKSEGGSDE